MFLGLCEGYIVVGYDIGLYGSELVFIPGWVGVESSWVGVEFTLKVVRLEDGIFPTTTPPPSRRNRRFRNASGLGFCVFSCFLGLCVFVCGHVICFMDI